MKTFDLTPASDPSVISAANGPEMVPAQRKEMTMTTTNKPIDKLRDGLLTATIWRNIGDDGKSRYSVTILRSYKKGDAWKETSSFSRNELLRVSHLAGKAYDRIAEIIAELKDQQADEIDPADVDPASHEFSPLAEEPIGTNPQQVQ